MKRWMMRRPALLLAVLVIAGWASMASAQETTTVQPAADGEVKAADQPAAPNDADKEKEKQEKAKELAEQKLLMAKVMDQARNYLVTVATRWDKDKGCCQYDLWGITDQQGGASNRALAGVERFKMGFGGQVVRYLGAYDHPYHKVLFSLARRVWAWHSSRT